ncbi:UPF0721 transmembrane protein [Halolactibacillus alkaliphilus]|uniref:Probable membrane transporter protein n=1 Tax=Halolactibacillus alkaliphilus TaxID=442899 RepID=A0A511WZN3_9BACI|nr:sulfite exporter TauE/SafE family protein [Halolactibacillus alkaliphilus]GEN56150.1 UPF0721 transmembrane protein [Halolactibacillus alkaliphilus]GGN66875.1 UPF0721 transmembrane protein [Halolactibacillus alkaliphilus]SFO71962.1 hypothetical protein SAMN05720591_10672 [Halolactibacillus alkaliphilus]
MEYIIIMILGLVAAILGSMGGLGGGIIIVPSFLILKSSISIIADLSPQVIVGTSLIVVVFNGFSSTLAYLKQKKVDVKVALLFFMGSAPGALVGVFLNQFLNVDIFLVVLGMVIIILSVLMIWRHKMQVKPLDSSNSTQNNSFLLKSILKIILAFSVGILSGLFGIGGGSLMVPTMIILLAFPPHKAVATSMLLVFLSALVSSSSHIAIGNVDWLIALLLIPGAIIGGKIGAELNQRLNGNTVMWVLFCLLSIVGVRLIIQGISLIY